MSLIENLNWRYATKKYATTKSVATEDIEKSLKLPGWPHRRTACSLTGLFR